MPTLTPTWTPQPLDDTDQQQALQALSEAAARRDVWSGSRDTDRRDSWGER